MSLLRAFSFGTCLLALGCGENLTAPGMPIAVEPFSCLPNLDGVVEAQEFDLSAGKHARYDVSPLREVDAEGEPGEGDDRMYRFDWSRADDSVFDFEVQALDAQWFAQLVPQALRDRFHGALVVLPADVDARYQLVLAKDDVASWLLALASTEESPDDEGQTWVLYEEPVAVHRFPLAPGESWTSVGRAPGSRLPLPGTPGVQLTEDRVDTYRVTVSAVGDADMGDFLFERVVQVDQELTTEFPSNALIPATVQLQTQYFAECGGEVVRLTARANDTASPIEQAEQTRRARLD